MLQEHTKIITFEPHLHAPGVRMCLEAIWGHNIQTLNCVGYDHNWVKQYVYDDDAAPLLPKGTIVHLIGFLDTTAANKNPADPRNWAGGGRRSIANMFIDLGYSVTLTEEQFQAEMAKRRANMKSRNDYDIGCPLCWAPPTAVHSQTPAARQAVWTRRQSQASKAARRISVWLRCALVVRVLAVVRGRAARADPVHLLERPESCRRRTKAGCRTTDGSFTMYFGYMNTNWLEEFDVPIGPDNSIEPGGPDQGQPTHFYPRRNPFLFTIQVPKDFGNKELIWTLTTHGKTEQAYASLKTDYHDRQTGDLDRSRRRLRQPARRAAHEHPAGAEGRGESGAPSRSGEPLTLVAFAGDPDNLPARRDGKPQPRNASGKMDGEGAAAPAPPRPRQPTNLANLSIAPPSSHRAVERPGPAAVVDRLSRQGRGRDLQPRSDEDVDRHARLRQLAVVAAVHHSASRRRTASGWRRRRSRSRAPTCSAPSRATARCSPTTT